MEDASDFIEALQSRGPYQGRRCNRLLSNHIRLLTRHAYLLFAVILITLFLAGCNKSISTSELARINANLGDLAIVPEPLSCSPDYKPWAGDPLSGFGKGAVEGANTVIFNMGSPGDGDLAAIAVLLFIGGGVAVGGRIGAFQTVPDEVSSEIERYSADFFDNKNINELIAGEVYSNSLRTRGDLHPAVFKKTIPSDGKDNDDPDAAFYQRLKQAGKETILSIKLTDLILEGGRGRKPTFPLHVKVHTQLVSVADNRMIFSKDYEFISEEHDWKSWQKNNGHLLVSELVKSYHELGEQIYREQIELPAHSIPFKSGLFSPSAEVSGGACFLRPVFPALKLKGPAELLFHPEAGLYIKATEADSVQPKLKWESFPRPRDKTAANAEMIERTTEVVYDLKIWKRSKRDGRILIYKRNRLPSPEHKIEYILAPGTDYYWSFRANYKFDGNPRDIPWAFYNYMPTVPCKSCYCDIEDVPVKNLFRFKTPVENTKTK